jgi:hypothetical protein
MPPPSGVARKIAPPELTSYRVYGGEAQRRNGIQSITINIDGRKLPGNRSLCTTPDTSQHNWTGPGSALNTEIENRFADCLRDGSNPSKIMFSFHSPKGNRNCQKYIKGEDSHPNDISANPTVLELCLQAQRSGKPVEIRIDGEEYRVAVEIDRPEAKPGETGVPHIAGQYVLTALNTHAMQQQVTLPFLELAPPFDGHCLNADVLLECNTKLQRFGALPTVQNNMNIQFSSAMGTCRGPALLIINQFAAYASQNPVPQHAIKGLVHGFISHARNQTGKNLLPSKTQETEIIKACTKLLEQINDTTAKSKQPEPEIEIKAPAPKVAAAPAFVECSRELDDDNSSIASIEDTAPSAEPNLQPLEQLVEFLSAPEVNKVLNKKSVQELVEQKKLNTGIAAATKCLMDNTKINNLDRLKLYLEKTCVEGLYGVLRSFEEDKFSILEKSNVQLAQLSTPEIRKKLLNCQKVAQFICLLNAQSNKSALHKYQRELLSKNNTAWLAQAFDLPALHQLNANLKNDSSNTDQPWFQSTRKLDNLIIRTKYIMVRFDSWADLV